MMSAGRFEVVVVDNDVAFLAVWSLGYITVCGKTNQAFRMRGNGGRKIEPVRIYTYLDANGYTRIRFRFGGRHFRIGLHRAVWIAHHKRLVPSGKVVDHIDGDAENNRIENLRLLSQADNLLHRDGRLEVAEEEYC